jgi:hypothetical protein
METIRNIVGKFIYKLYLNDAKDEFGFIFLHPGAKERYSFCLYKVESQCCSESWIETIESYENIKEEVVTEVSELNLYEEIDIKYQYCKRELKEHNDCLKKYGLDIKTKKGTCTIDYRNASTGFYGADISNMHKELFCDDYYYLIDVIHRLGFKEALWK